MSDGYQFKRIVVALLFAATTYLLQIIPLLWGRSFAGDWVNHVWMIQYYADYLLDHGSFPGTFDAAQAFGNPSPIFYGIFFYPIMSLVAAATSADMAVRLYAAGLLLAPLVSFSVLFKRLTRDTATAIFLAVIVNSSVYQMTNLYARSAITEFFAIQFLMFGLSLCSYGLIVRSKSALAALFFGAAWIVVALGTHPTTVYTFVLFTAPVAALSMVAARKYIIMARFLTLIALIALMLMAFSPSLSILIANKDGLEVTTTDALAGALRYFPSSIDSTFGRIGLFYFDPRVAAAGIDETSTPFLDAPFSVAVAVIFGYLAYRIMRSSLLATALVVIPTLLSASALIYTGHAPSGAPSGLFPGSVKAMANDGFLYALLVPIQFAYRLAGTWHLTISTAVISGLVVLGRDTSDGKMLRNMALVAAAISLVGLSQKLYLTNLEFRQYPRYQADFRPGGPSTTGSDIFLLLDQDKYARMVADTKFYPPLYYGQVGYSTPGNLPATPATPDVPSIKLVFAHWGDQQSVSCSTPCLLRTNLLPSPSNKITVDGETPRKASLSPSGTLDLQLPAGVHNIHIEKLGRRFIATQISIWLVLAWMGVSLSYLLWIVSRNVLLRVSEYRLRPPVSLDLGH